MEYLFGVVLSLLAVFLILLVLVQRGRGGGLAGALGGLGGSSAFGAKAGDQFTRITIVVVAIWIGICVLAKEWARSRPDSLTSTGGSATTDSQTAPAGGAPLMPGPPATPPAGEAPPKGPLLTPPVDTGKEEGTKAAADAGAPPAGAARGGEPAAQPAADTKTPTTETPKVDK
jgi:preprotein translocase subunit SecG